MSRILYNGKWSGIWNRDKYESFRNKILGTFSELEFEEGPHKYYLHGKEITCVSNVTHMFKEEEDWDKIASETSERNFNKPESKYYQMTKEQILEAWDKNSKQACDHGTIRHEFGESCFYFMTEQYDKILPAFKDRLIPPSNDQEGWGFQAIFPKEEAIVKYWESIPVCIVPILAENKVYDEGLGYSGTFDILFYYDATLDERGTFDNSKSGFYIMDYKSNKDLYKNFDGKKLVKPFDELLDMPLSIYKLQLSLYQNCLEQIGFKVVARCLIWMKPDGTFVKIKLEEYVKTLRKELEKMDLKNRANEH